jgi:hypothetical protein
MREMKKLCQLWVAMMLLLKFLSIAIETGPFDVQGGGSKWQTMTIATISPGFEVAGIASEPSQTWQDCNQCQSNHGRIATNANQP